MSFWTTALDVGSSIAGAVLVTGGTAVSRVQETVGLQERGRRLSDDEVALLRRVFRDSVALERVRLVEGRAGLFDVNTRPFVLGNTIYMKGRSPAAEPALLVHEVTHVWQYQHLGSSYASDALGAQLFVESAYEWERELERGRTEWPQFNREAQASFLEDLYTDGCCMVHPEAAAGGAPTENPSLLCGNGIFYDADGERLHGRFWFRGADRTELAHRALSVVRRG